MQLFLTVMSLGIRIPDNLVQEAKTHSQVNHRSISSQIAYWVKIGKIAEENPDLNFKMIKDILIGMEQLDRGQKSEYKFD